jgi:hypothetical protein
MPVYQCGGDSIRQSIEGELGHRQKEAGIKRRSESHLQRGGNIRLGCLVIASNEGYSSDQTKDTASEGDGRSPEARMGSQSQY